MTMEYMGFHHGYQPSYDVEAFTGPVQGQHRYPYITYEQRQQQLALAQFQQQRAAAMMIQGSMPQVKATETKPRLAKDEVETLEREFQKNPKPNSSLKRELADQMRVDVARINNWFQNRRAKAKQMRKTQEFEAQQAAEKAAASESESPKGQGEGTSSDLYGLSNHSQPALSSSAFVETDGSPVQQSHSPFPHDDDQDQKDASPAMQSGNHLLSQKGEVDSAESQHFFQNGTCQPSPTLRFASRLSDTTFGDLDTTFGTSHPCGDFQSPLDITIEDHSIHHNLPLLVSSVDGFDTTRETVSEVNSFAPLPDSRAIGSFSSPGQSFSPLVLPIKAELAENNTPEDSTSNELSNESSIRCLSPGSLAQPSPTSTADQLRFKSPPRLDIATRRNLRRPAQLNPTAFRSYSYGPKTGIEVPKRSDTQSPMRRIASATVPMQGRVQKSLIGGPPRSPMFSDRNKEAFLRSLQGALSPVTPNECFNGVQYASRETTVSSNASSCDDDQKYTFGSSQNPYFPVGAANGKTPPGTPAFQTQYPINSMEAAWNFVPSDEPLVTPGLGSFGSDLEFPTSQSAPGYAASQPATPSFAPGIGPTFYPMFTGSGGSNLEYKFPESCGPESSARSSPIQPPASKNFQFTQNVTPQDFN